MGYMRYQPNYDLQPKVAIKGFIDQVHQGAQKIVEILSKHKHGVVCFECYPGVDLDVLLKDIIQPLVPNFIINIEDYAKSDDDIDYMIKDHLTDDRVFGIWSHHRIDAFYDKKALDELKKHFSNQSFVVVYGFGASLMPYDTLIHVGLTRWEIQLRYRQGMTNFKADNSDEDILRKYKRGYFVEWRVADRIKSSVFNQIDYHIDYNLKNQPKMSTHTAYQFALDTLVHRPFRMTPYFDPGVWGGQWMKENFQLNHNQTNYAWCFDGVPEENSVCYDFSGITMDMPAQDVVDFRSKALLGDRAHGRFGKHFPIRFDMLDTMGGENLSLQVHPLTEYIQDRFGMTYTQDESYYILDAMQDGTVYLGFKKGIDNKQFENDLKKANQGDLMFDAEQYVNKLPVKKHDHFSIPAGTVHCSGKNTMVLEISACVYIFTFKLWDWGRLGLDGKPRPVHLEHGFNVIQYDRDTDFVMNELVNPIQKINDIEEITGLHEREFLETRRYTFDESIVIETHGSVNMANLVEGSAAIIESIEGAFEPFEVHYAETFIVPSTIRIFRIKPSKQGEKCILIKAHVR